MRFLDKNALHRKRPIMSRPRRTNHERAECRNCKTVFNRDRSWQIFCSDLCRARWHKLTDMCFYCGDIASSRDHVIPVKEIGQRRWINVELVPACTECNGSLGGKSDLSFRERMTRRIEHHAKKYDLRIGLEPPAWSEDEIAELGPNLQTTIRAGIRKRSRAEERLLYMMQVLWSWNDGKWRDK